VKHIVDTLHNRVDTRAVAHVADVELHIGLVQLVPHDVLLQLIAAEDPNFGERAPQQELQQLVAEGAGASADQNRFTAKVVHDR
jgi:hypothetical protein